MAIGDTPPYRADHVGSLLHPLALLAAREAFAAGTLDAEGLRGQQIEQLRLVVETAEAVWG